MVLDWAKFLVNQCRVLENLQEKHHLRNTRLALLLRLCTEGVLKYDYALLLKLYEVVYVKTHILPVCSNQSTI